MPYAGTPSARKGLDRMPEQSVWLECCCEDGKIMAVVSRFIKTKDAELSTVLNRNVWPLSRCATLYSRCIVYSTLCC